MHFYNLAVGFLDYEVKNDQFTHSCYSNYNSAELRACFYKEADFTRTIDKCKLILDNLKGLKYCIHGLEIFTELGSSKITALREDPWIAVLTDLHIECYLGTRCPTIRKNQPQMPKTRH